MSELDSSKCIICQCDTQESLIQMTEKGLVSVVNSCVARKLHGLEVQLTDSPGPYLTHSTCRKRFTDLRHLTSSGDTDDVPVKCLRSSVELFDWKHMCFFCIMPADFDSDKASVRQACTLELRQSILNRCTLRGDEWALDVQGRLEDCCDLVHPEAVYHQNCHTRFFQGRTIDRGLAGRREDAVMTDGFENMCEWLEVCCENRLYTLEDLREHMTSCVQDKVEYPIDVYSAKYLK